ncbi:ABC transporter substrate-binding protein [Lapidilactobacillus achengensis]|uniref:ABC transporter substrate-binding protein n=1 Tax=Lapidilactobacillus achengensis TaxID=2486000 RepID=A0ABW1UTB3_9LACO|nr:extracellular solute-binding protein [Lapidilactobacillus achengensis]
MKKGWLLGLAVVLALGVSGCGKKSTGKAENKTLTVWTSYTEGAGTGKEIKKTISEFEKKTGYTVKQSNFTYDMMHDKIKASAAGGNLPDVIWGLPEYIGEFNKMGILEDITTEVNKWDQKDKITKSALETMKVNGKYVAIPYEATVRAYLTHEDDFKKANATAPKTWSDLLALKSFKDETGKYPYSIAGKGAREPQELIVYLAQYGLEIASEKNGKYKNTWNENADQLEKATKVFQFYKDLVAEGIVDKNSANLGWEDTDENFASGITASYVTGNWLQEREATNPDTMKDVAVNAIPYPTDGKPATYLEAKPLFVLKNDTDKKMKVKLAEAFLSKKAQKAAFLDRSPRIDVSGDSKWSKDFKKLSEYGVTFPPVTVSNISQNMIDALAKVLQEGKEPKEAAKWLSTEVNKSLEDNDELAK